MTIHRYALVLLAALSAPAQQPGWQSMFDGTLAKWRNAEYPNQPPVRLNDATLVLEPGSPLTGINWAGEFPKSNYEVRFEAARLAGNDFFASLTFPVKDSFCTMVTGGWGGDIVGLSSIDGWDASDNETRTYVNFENGRWYAFRIEVTDEKIRAWIDEKLVVNTAIGGRSIGLRPGDIKLSVPFGFASYRTRGALRKIEYRLLTR
jgi:hypothetical protein